MQAFDAETGAERWRSSYPAPYSPSQAAAVHGSGPKATPLYYEGRIFTLGISGIVAAFHAETGKLLWRTDAPTEHPFFSAASSPIADGDLILTHPGNYGPVTAFAVATGEVKWTAGASGFFQSPTIMTLGGKRQVVTVTQKSVIGVSVPTGELLWEFPFPGAAGGPMPVPYGDDVIVSALDAGVTCVRPTLRGGIWTVERVWETKDVSLYISDPVVVGDTLFGLSRRNRGQFFALDAKTGAVLWLGPPRAAENAAFAKAGDLLFILKDDGELIVARASRKGLEPLKRYTVADSATWAQPAIFGSSMYIKDVSSLSLWRFE
jgi:outer membrane protein assembly factor BamB